MVWKPQGPAGHHWDLDTNPCSASLQPCARFIPKTAQPDLRGHTLQAWDTATLETQLSETPAPCPLAHGNGTGPHNQVRKHLGWLDNSRVGRPQEEELDRQEHEQLMGKIRAMSFLPQTDESHPNYMYPIQLTQNHELLCSSRIRWHVGQGDPIRSSGVAKTVQVTATFLFALIGKKNSIFHSSVEV